MGDVVLEEPGADLLERGLDRGDLGEDVDAVAVLLDHPLDAAHLSLDAVQAPGQRLLVLGVAMHQMTSRREKAPQAQAVGDDEDARERHGRGGDDRVEQPGDGERDRRDVVGERPEEVPLIVRSVRRERRIASAAARRS